jgi:ribonuclease HII
MRDSDDLAAKPLERLRRDLLEGKQPASGKLLRELERDPRKGARRLALLLRRREASRRAESLRLRDMFRFERELWDRGVSLIAGVDEAGMAPLAGPVVAAAVILPRGFRLPGLNDSKRIAGERRREELALRIKRDAVCWSVGQAEVEEIDRLNIYHAGLLAMRRAVKGLALRPEYILVDARTIPHLGLPQRGIIRGDALSASIAAASLIAKTSRDAQMIAMDALYPGYGFASHKGYPTPAHLRALRQHGPLPVHRRTFGPVRRASCLEPRQVELFSPNDDSDDRET